ncbi:hypothetical protein OPT61_g78 [Boeremia exigua]|uniref:Uncharacterized protein n=1 Tax=Boeremia exigua TaxID=749465 RepID=A0ACC2IVB1_9PLEO|nr:hypothetical protein OPT61_g78 [Boeremia exigua]
MSRGLSVKVLSVDEGYQWALPSFTALLVTAKTFASSARISSVTKETAFRIAGVLSTLNTLAGGVAIFLQPHADSAAFCHALNGAQTAKYPSARHEAADTSSWPTETAEHAACCSKEILTGPVLPILHSAACNALPQARLRHNASKTVTLSVVEDIGRLSRFRIKDVLVSGSSRQSEYKKHDGRQQQKLCRGSASVFFSRFLPSHVRRIRFFAMLSSLILCLSFAAAAFAGQCNFNLELTYGKGSPDGYERDMIFINGQYPGPHLEIQQGDWVEVEVVNNMPFNSSIHYHGIHQTNTPWADGVPGLTQRPIQPGGSYKYRWHADQAGSYFYHAHSRGQIDDGAYGPITIKSRGGSIKPFDMISPADVHLLEEAEADVIPVMLSDWRHRTSEQTWADQLASGIETSVCMDALLVNGKGAVDCWSREEITKFTSPAIAPALAQTNLVLTDKGCFPPALFPFLLGNGTVLNPSAIPPSVFDICTPTQGSRETIKAPRHKKWLALDVVSSAGIDTFAFSIDEHPLWVYAVDGHYIEPVLVDVLTVANGDRYSVFVELKNPRKKNNFGIRVQSLALVQLIDTTALFTYSLPNQHEGGYNTTPGPYTNTSDSQISSRPYTNRAGQPVSPDVTVLDHASTSPFPPQFPQPAPSVAQTFFLTSGSVGNSYTWALNATPFSHAAFDNTVPLLYLPPALANGDGNITLVTKNATWIDLVFLVPNLSQPPHPIHKHGNRAFILGAGAGNFTWPDVASAAAERPELFNLVNPSYRDGFVTPPTVDQPTWLAVRYKVENPGAWMLHCHIQSHLTGGMAVVILDGVDEWPEVPAEYQN